MTFERWGWPRTTAIVCGMPDGTTEPVPFRTLLHTTRYGDYHREPFAGIYTVDSGEEWPPFGITRRLPLRRSPLGQELVLVVALGPCPSSGFEVTIHRVDLLDAQLRVQMRESQPAGAVLDIITCPVHAVVIPHLTGVESITMIQSIVTSRD
ncbi:protease complex subunit PrcB family protein [Micromonospora sp. M12]